MKPDRKLCEDNPFKNMSVKQAEQGFTFITLLILSSIGWMTFLFYAQFLNIILAAVLTITMVFTFAALGTLQLICVHKIFTDKGDVKEEEVEYGKERVDALGCFMLASIVISFVVIAIFYRPG